MYRKMFLNAATLGDESSSNARLNTNMGGDKDDNSVCTGDETEESCGVEGYVSAWQSQIAP